MNTFKKLSLVAIFIALVCIFFSVKYIFRLKNISCQAKDGASCPQTVIDLLSLYLSDPLLFIDQNELEKKLSQDPSLSDIVIKKKFPKSLFVSLKITSFQIPVVLLNEDITKVAQDKLPLNATTRSILLQSGQLITAKNDTDSNIFINQSLSQPQLLLLASFLKDIADKLQFTALYAQQDSIYIRLTSGQTVIILIKKPAADFLSALHSIQQQATIKTVKIIDLRFNHPVLK